MDWKPWYIVHTTLPNQNYLCSQWADFGIWIYFSNLVLLCPLSCSSQTNVQMTKYSKTDEFFQTCKRKYESSMTNATTFTFLLYFMSAIEMKK